MGCPGALPGARVTGVAGGHGNRTALVNIDALARRDDFAGLVRGAVGNRQCAVDVEAAARAGDGLAVQVNGDRLVGRNLGVRSLRRVVCNHNDRVVVGRSKSLGGTGKQQGLGHLPTDIQELDTARRIREIGLVQFEIGTEFGFGEQ